MSRKKIPAEDLEPVFPCDEHFQEVIGEVVRRELSLGSQPANDVQIAKFLGTTKQNWHRMQEDRRVSSSALWTLLKKTRRPVGYFFPTLSGYTASNKAVSSLRSAEEARRSYTAHRRRAEDADPMLWDLLDRVKTIYWKGDKRQVAMLIAMVEGGVSSLGKKQ